MSATADAAVSVAEVVRPWLSTGFLGALCLMVGRMGKPVAEYLIETHKLKAQAKKDDRQGYGDLIETLSTEVRELLEETARQRIEIRSLHELIDGMTRGDLQARISTQSAVLHKLPPDFVPPATAAALDRIEDSQP